MGIEAAKEYRCQLSARGRAQYDRLPPERLGWAHASPRIKGRIIVKWDGTAYPAAYSEGCIERAQVADPVVNQRMNGQTL